MQMKKIFLVAIGIVCLMASCTKDEMQADPINPNEGKEVVFSSSIGEATRTLYAEENGNKIAVKWVDGDLISVYGSTCAVNQSDYTVKAATGTETTGGVSTNYYYAESLTKTGDVGVQWGNEETSNFYAVYPSVGDNQFTKVDGGVKVQTTVRPKQNVTFTKTTADGTVTWVGQHYNGAASNPTMTDAVMYAYTAGATSGKQVDLKFKPFSTVLRFTFKGFKAIQSSGEIDTEYNTSTVAVNKIVLTAPNTKIAGDFVLTINENEDGTASASATEGTSNTIEIYPDYLPMKNNEQLQFDIFTIPTANVMPQDAALAWKVQVVTDKGTFTFNMVPKTVTTPTNAPVAGLALTTGALHKLTIPLKTVTFDFDIPVGEWIKYIPRNVYLTELSYPGAWYFYSSDYQGDVTAQDLFDAGVRAFHIDCRLTLDTATDVTADNEKSYYDNGQLRLVCAGTDAGGSAISGGFTQGTAVESMIDGLKSLLVKDSTSEDYEEFIIVSLTIAEKPCTRSGRSFGSINPTYVLPAIQTALSNLIANGVPIYQGPITPNTTVNDVKGKIVVIVNENTTDATFATYATPTALVARGSLWFGDADYNFGSNLYQNSFKSMQSSSLYWKNAANTDSDMTMYFHFAQRTSENAIGNSSDSDSEYQHLAVVADRVSAVQEIASKAQEIYASGKHNAWYQISTGGYIRNRVWGREALNWSKHWYDADEPGVAQRASVTKSLNDALLTIVNNKLSSTGNMVPSPVGIVLSNFSAYDTYSGSTTNSLSLNQAIFDMNTKFYLERNHEADEWPGDYNPFETTTPDDSGNNGDGTGGNDDGQIGEQ